MRVLVACEFSGIVRDAFIARGHDAVSVDLLPSERPGPHIIGDALEAAYGSQFSLLIAHPPCTYLANSGVRWLYGGRGNVPDPVRCGQRIVGREADQIIQPWQFGHGEIKATCLWLRGLPPLVPTEIVDGRVPRVHFASPGPERWRERSRTLPGIAAAMADQWGSL